jgi:hypothetical protein
MTTRPDAEALFAVHLPLQDGFVAITSDSPTTTGSVWLAESSFVQPGSAFRTRVGVAFRRLDEHVEVGEESGLGRPGPERFKSRVLPGCPGAESSDRS